MDYTVEKKDDGTAVLAITVPWSEMQAPFDTEIAAAVAYTRENSSIKGFRKGHVPEEVAREQVNRAHVLSSVVDAQVQEAFASAVTTEKLKAVGTPRVSVKKMAEGNDVEVEIGVDLVPEVTLPKKWQKIVSSVNKDMADDEVAVADEDVDAELARLAESRTESREVERSAADGDQVTIDFVVRRDGTPIEGGTSTDHTLILGKKAFIPGFEEEVIGMDIGTTKEFTLTFPEKYHAEDLAGQDAAFEVTLKKVEERTVPALDDAFAASLGEQFTTLADLRTNISDGMRMEKENAASEKRKAAYLEKLSEEVETPIPAGLRQDEIDRMVAEMEQQIVGSGMSFDDYLAHSGQSRAALAEAWAPQADKRIKSALLLECLGEELQVEPEKAAVEERMNEMIQAYGGAEALGDTVDMQQIYSYTKGVLRNDLVFDKLSKL